MKPKAFVSAEVDYEIAKKLEEAGFKVDYVTKKENRLYAAVFLEEVRLIDNIEA